MKTVVVARLAIEDNECCAPRALWSYVEAARGSETPQMQGHTRWQPRARESCGLGLAERAGSATVRACDAPPAPNGHLPCLMMRFYRIIYLRAKR